MKYYLLTSDDCWSDEHDVPALAVMTEQELEKWSQTRLSIRAYLGNGGQCFMEREQGKTGSELIHLKCVKVMEVNENFASVFKQANLQQLSLSNIFDLDNEYEGE